MYMSIIGAALPEKTPAHRNKVALYGKFAINTLVLQSDSVISPSIFVLVGVDPPRNQLAGVNCIEKKSCDKTGHRTN